MPVTNNKLTVLSNKFSKQKFMFYLQFCEQFLCCFDILCLCGHHHMGLAIGYSLIATFRKTLIVQQYKPQWETMNGIELKLPNLRLFEHFESHKIRNVAKLKTTHVCSFG